MENLFPQEVISNAPRMTLTGRELLHVEQHQGLIAYQQEKIVFRTAAGLVHVTGTELCFKRYSAGEAVITGNIESVGFPRHGGNA